MALETLKGVEGFVNVQGMENMVMEGLPEKKVIQGQLLVECKKLRG